jgi:hypothetical protein
VIDLAPAPAKSVKYPFRKLRVYFNAVVAVLALVFSVLFLINPVNVWLLSSFFAIITASTVMMFYVKLRLLIRMAESESEPEQALLSEAHDSPGRMDRWIILLLAVLLAVFMGLPVLLLAVVDAVWWFIGLAGFVTGASLSEVVLYFSTQR